MEKIVIFIIIMIVSSYFSKKKKQSQANRHVASTTFYDDKRNVVSKPVASSRPGANLTQQPQSMSEALNELKNIFSNTPKQQPKPKPAPVYETNYNEESNMEDYTKSSENNYKEAKSNYDTYMSKNEEQIINKDSSVFNIPKPKEVKNSYSIERKAKILKKDIFSNLFNTRNSLKRAVIINEVFNKKY